MPRTYSFEKLRQIQITLTNSNSLALIDVVIGETRVTHLDEGQYQFFRYNIDPVMAADGNYLLRIETVAVNGDVIVSIV